MPCSFMTQSQQKSSAFSVCMSFILCLSLCLLFSSAMIRPALADDNASAKAEDVQKDAKAQKDAPKAASRDAKKQDAGKADAAAGQKDAKDGKKDEGTDGQAKEEKKTEKEEEAKAAEMLRIEREKAQAEAETVQKSKEAEELSQADVLDDMWVSQRGHINAVIQDAMALSENFLQDTASLEQLRSAEQDIRRLIIMVGQFKQWPGPLEAVSRRLGNASDLAEMLMQAAAAPQVNARKLLDQLNASMETWSDLSLAHMGETKEYLTKINTARFMLTAIIARYASALGPTTALVNRAKETKAEITKFVPELWLKYYTSGPVPWLTFSEWKSLPQKLSYFSAGLSMRKNVEVPMTTSQWQGAITRFCISLLAFTCLFLLISNRVLQGHPEILSHTKRCSLPWNVLGLSLLTASYTPTLEPFRLFLAVGNLCLIMGQLSLAWDLRRIRYTEVEKKLSPLLALMPPTFAAYLLLYMPLPQLVTLLIWSIWLVVNIIWARRRSQNTADLGQMRLEKVILDMQPLVLWPCLIVCLAGFHFYSMAIYLLYSSLSIAIQVSLALLSIISKMNEELKEEDSSTMLTSFLLALAAPVAIMLAFSALSLWLCTLPGGLDILQYYIFKSVSIGETQLNFMQVLFIATAFLLARTFARMGRTFISHLPEQSPSFDPTLITPLQTIYFYLVWFCFILFSLRSLGMNLGNLAVIAGGLSVGIGFGMQAIVNNFISGIILIFSRTLQVGDVVEVGGVVGRVRRISVRATVVETYDSAIIYVPNSAFVSSNLTNWTSNSRSCRKHVKVSVAYGSDVEKVTRILLDVANKQSDILAFPKPSVSFLDFGASNLNLKLSFWVKDYEQFSTPSDLLVAINKRFAEEHIEIAYDTLDIHVRKSNEPQKSTSVRRRPLFAPKRRRSDMKRFARIEKQPTIREDMEGSTS